MKENLIAARALVARGWVQEHNAVDADGRRVPADHPSACAWCSVGALRAVLGSAAVRERAAIKDANDIHNPLVLWNDALGRTQAEVLAAFDRAIEAA